MHDGLNSNKNVYIHRYKYRFLLLYNAGRCGIICDHLEPPSLSTTSICYPRMCSARRPTMNPSYNNERELRVKNFLLFRCK